MRRAISVDKLSLTVNPGAFAVTDSGFGIVWGNLCSQSVKVLEAQISCKGFSISYKILILLVLIQLPPRDHVSAARSCLQKFLEVSQQCLREEDRPGLNVTLQMVDSAIAFTCHNSGDRIALFMSEEGVECVTTHKEEILACINQSVPEVFNTYNNLHNYKMHFYVFQQENCRYMINSIMPPKHLHPQEGRCNNAVCGDQLDEVPGPDSIESCARAVEGNEGGDALWSGSTELAHWRLRSSSPWNYRASSHSPQAQSVTSSA